MQTRFELTTPPVYFHHPEAHDCRLRLFQWDLEKNKPLGAIQLPETLPFNFKGARIIQQRNSLLIFKSGRAVNVYRLFLSKLNRHSYTALTPLQKGVSQYALAIYNDHVVYLSGGYGEGD